MKTKYIPSYIFENEGKIFKKLKSAFEVEAIAAGKGPLLQWFLFVLTCNEGLIFYHMAKFLIN